MTFIVYGKPQPQGSMKAFVIPGTNRASITSDNAKMKPFRQAVTKAAITEAQSWERLMPLHRKHVPVKLTVRFTFLRPPRVKDREFPVVKPDIDKLQRCILDALTGVGYVDDAQVVAVDAQKVYGPVECVEIAIEAVGG